MPTAKATKLLLIEYMRCLRSADHGAQYPSAAIWLRRMSRKPCMLMRSASMRFRKFRIAPDGIPRLSGEGALVNTFSFAIFAPQTLAIRIDELYPESSERS